MRWILICLFAVPMFAAEPKPPRGLDMDYGPVLSYSVLKPGAPAKRAEKAKKGEIATGYPWTADELIAARGITVKVGPDAAVTFDAETMRYAAGWTGGWLDVTKSHLANEKGLLPPSAKGTLAFTSVNAPGFAKKDSFDDPRPHKNGPLPRDWAHFTGIYRDGETVVFAYTVGDAKILDLPGFVAGAGGATFTRTIRVEQSTQPIKLVVCAAGGFQKIAEPTQGATIASEGNRVIATLPAVNEPTQFTIAFSSVAIDAVKPPSDISLHTHGGNPLWDQTVVTQAVTGADKDAYTVDTISLPDKNPWHAWVRPTALDFFKDGRCALCTWNGDVWIASPLSSHLAQVQWKRFASGLYDPLGIRVLNDEVYVLARNGIVRLRDLNGDGEADYYENFNGDRPTDAYYNSFAMDLVTNSAGSFYYAVAGAQISPTEPLHNDLLRVAPDGSYLEEVCSGMRTANGLGVGPHDEITFSDNQGNWVPSSPIFLAKPGAFYNFAGQPGRSTKEQMAAMLRDHPKVESPICWIPYSWDNSSGGQVWAGEKFGPLSGHLLHTSYGKGTIFEVLTEQVDGIWQGAAVQLPLRFDSGIQRARVNPVDGQVWVTGLHGWQTAGPKDGCLQRVRYTGKPCALPTALHVGKKGFTISFDVPLDPETAGDTGSYGIEQWAYHTSEAYGSDDYKPSDPNAKGHDTLDVKKATLSADKKSVTLEVDGLQPVQQYVIKARLQSVDGATIKCDLGGTINVIGK